DSLHYLTPSCASLFTLEHSCFRFTQPSGKQSKTRDDVNKPRRNPHNQSAQLLVFKRRQSPRCCVSFVSRIPDALRESYERAEQSAVNGGRENVKSRRAVTE